MEAVCEWDAVEGSGDGDGGDVIIESEANKSVENTQRGGFKKVVKKPWERKSMMEKLKRKWWFLAPLNAAVLYFTYYTFAEDARCECVQVWRRLFSTLKVYQRPPHAKSPAL